MSDEVTVTCIEHTIENIYVDYLTKDLDDTCPLCAANDRVQELEEENKKLYSLIGPMCFHLEGTEEYEEACREAESMWHQNDEEGAGV